MGATINLLVMASMPIAKVLLLAAIGSFLGLDHVNILGEDARHHLNKVVFYVFNPALVTSTLAKTITFESFLTLWFMPVNIFITYLLGSILGWVLIKITKAPRHLKGLIIGACSAGNLGKLPLIIVPAMCREKGSPFGDVDVCQSYGLAYASLSMALGNFYMWLYTYNIIRIFSRDVIDDANHPEVGDESFGNNTEFLLKPTEYSLMTPNNKIPMSSKFQQLLSQFSGKINLKPLFSPSTIGVVLLITAIGSFLALDRVDILGNDARKHLNKVVFFVFGPALIASNLAKAVTFETFLTLWFMPINIFITYLIGSLLGWILAKVTKVPKHFKGLIIGSCSAGSLGKLPIIIVPAMCNEKGSPFGAVDVCHSYAMAYASLSMAIIGFMIGMISPLRNLLIGNDAPLHVVQDAAYMLGDATIPAITLILGANLLPGLKGSQIQIRTIICIAVVRYILLPLLGLVIVRGAVHVGILHIDPLFQFILLLQYALPPAMSIRSGLGYLLVKVTKAPKHHKVLIIGACSAGNLGNMLIILVPAMCKEKGSPFGAPDVCEIYALSYASLSMAVLGFGIGMMSPIRNLMIGNDAPLHVVMDSALLLGFKGSGIQPKVVIGIVVSRYIILPLLGILIVKGAIQAGFVPINNKLFVFVLLVQYALPPAINLGNMGIFPIILIPAICKEKGSPFGAIDACETYALSYSSLSLAIGAVYIWSLVYNIVRMSAEEITRDKGLIDSSGIHIKDSNQEPLLPCSEDHCLAASHQVINSF
uniref:Uncharacterized protein n=1 Tax=Chenopodium quinoa TaxID=63459 RepID=A0A803KWC3_CHEQI